MSEFMVYPAIDLRKGKVVRLEQGDPLRQKTYADDPKSVAQIWLEAGATWLHIVNLDGAFGDALGLDNLAALKGILSTGAQLQYGGGLRSWEAIETILNVGVSRIILGTAAIEQPELVRRSIAACGAGRVAVGIDVRQGHVRVRGWTEAALMDPLALAHEVKKLGVERAIVTDITKDGMDRGVNVDLARKIAAGAGLSVIAAGGVNSLEDVRRARQAALEGIVIGRALYEGQISLKEALRC